ncbi:GGDEF domain-containing protein [Paenibacillus sp. R14(2021)]|uniref:GGDEF domain-containing protein n=1 Tax=Paenibacillus sp. R14(2021) TaxID=2859228 RepID=UPI001C616275|nr:GGDEF domain-containing protein [Paenibacillus sp. R14(2021)]
MSVNGRLVAGAAALITTAATAGLCYMTAIGHSLFSVQLGVVVFASSMLTGGWMLGRKYDRLKEESTIDCLTNVYNRRFIEVNFNKLLKQAERKRKKMTIILLDVNDFKEVNDRFGHLQGDKALALIAETLRNCSERGEIAGRWGGDEFILICPYADDKGIERITKRIHEQLLSVSRRSGLRLSVSVGSASFPEHGGNLAQLTLAADTRMYADKYVRKVQETEPAALQA